MIADATSREPCVLDWPDKPQGARRNMTRDSSFGCVVLLIGWATFPAVRADTLPFSGTTFQGRIAYSADGNHNDPDDWISSSVALAIFAEAGLKDRLVHFDYNCILPLTNPEWEKIHADSVLGAVERYAYDRSLFHDCRKDRDGAVASIARAINDSSADNPLFFIIAGPVEIPLLGIEKSDPQKRRHVYCISHSQWNDGFAAKYTFTHTKRSVIATGIRWVQLPDQNRLLSFGRYGTPAKPEEFQPYYWMRDSRDPKVRFLWERMQISTRPDPSDSGMAYYLVSGDVEATPEKFKRLLDEHVAPVPVAVRPIVRLEAENFRDLTGFELRHGADRAVSHRLHVESKPDAARGAQITTDFNEPYTAEAGRYDVAVRCASPGGQGRYRLTVAGQLAGDPWSATAADGAWETHVVPGVLLRRGDAIGVVVEAGSPVATRLDYLDLVRRE
jgi:hypothetical protein